MKKNKILILSALVLAILGLSHDAWSIEISSPSLDVDIRHSGTLASDSFYEPQEGKMCKNIAIIGAGAAGIVQAIAFLEKFGNTVDVHIFEQHHFFDLSKGVELSVGLGFQIVMQALGHDMTTDLQKYGYQLRGVSVIDSRGNPLSELEEKIQSTAGIYSAIEEKIQIGDPVKIYPYNINRGVFMKLLQDQLLIVTKGKNIIHWGYQLDNITSDKTKKTLHFKNGQSFPNFDLIVGADGVHSKVRERLFDNHKASHVGANILYGIIPGQIEIFKKDKFNIICSKRFTTVSCCYKNLDEELITWWAIVYPDKENPKAHKEFRTFWESQTDVKALASSLVSEEEGNTYPKQYIQHTKEFKYAGFFLERDPTLLQNWGINNVVLIGDAAHAMQPWAGAGASLAAEDGYVLAELINQYGFHQLQLAFDEFQHDRMNRVLYFRQLTRNHTPQGIMPTEIPYSVEEVIMKYGDQRPLTACPAWQDMLDKRYQKQLVN